MEYLRRSVAFFFALQQLKLDLSSISAETYQEIFDKIESHDPGMHNLMGRVVKVKSLLLPFIHHRDTCVRLVLDVDNILLKHPLYSWTLTQNLLVSMRDVLGVTDGFARKEWVQEMREEEIHFMFSLLSTVKYHKETLTNKKLFAHFDLDFIEKEAFLVLKEYKEDFGIDTVYMFYNLAFSALPKPKKGTDGKRNKL